MKIQGVIIDGKGEGTRIGYPTANVRVDSGNAGENGVFLCEIIVREVKYPGLAVHGVVPPDTVTGNQVVEVYILDFEKNIRGERVSVDIQEKIRDLETFANEEELVRQIDHDVMQAVDILEEEGR